MTHAREPAGARARLRFAVLAVAAIEVSTQRHTFVSAVRRFGHLRPGWLLVAVAAEVASFGFAAELQHRLLSSARVRVERSFLVALTYAGAAASRTIPAGEAVAVGYSYRRLVRHGIGAQLSTWTLVASGVVSVSMLAVLGVVGAQLRGVGAAGSALGALIGILVLATVTATIAGLAWAGRHASVFERTANGLSRIVDRVGRRRRRSTRSTPHATTPVAIDVRLWGWLHACGLSTGNWLADMLAVGATFLALGYGVPWSRLLWAYVVIQLIVSIPFVGCIGLAEGSMTLALICIGVRPAPALAVVLVYRLVSFWLTLPLGWFASRHLARAESTQSPSPGRFSSDLRLLKPAAADSYGRRKLDAEPAARIGCGR